MKRRHLVVQSVRMYVSADLFDSFNIHNISYHFVIVFLNLGYKSHIYICFGHANFDAIREHIINSNISQSIRNCCYVDDMVSTFYQFICDTFEKFVLRASMRSNYRPKWHDKYLSHLRNVRNRSYNKLCKDRKTLMVADDRSFIMARAEYENYRNELHSNYIKEQANNLRNDPKSFRQHINSKRKSNVLLPIIEYGGHKASSDAEKADNLASFLQTVYVDHPTDNSLNSFIDQRTEYGCNGILITDDIVTAVLNKMNVSKGSGH